jgi:transcriptional regulator with XRE-family HTH domain
METLPLAHVVRIRELRLARGWSQEKLAVYAGVTRATLARLETGGRTSLDRSNVATLQAVARALGVSVAELAPGLSNIEQAHAAHAAHEPRAHEPLDEPPPEAA